MACELLGMWLVRRTEDGVAAGMIVEAEAYGGPDDRASHARAGRTRRTAPMFGPPGHAYVYLVYGMHQCLNVSARDAQPAGAVLLRALEPMVGTELMRRRRARVAEPDHRLASGPARLCQALAVDRSFDGHDLTLGRELWLALPPDEHDRRPGPAANLEVCAGPRIGVGYAGEHWAGRPWRFWLRDHRSVSR